MYRYGSAGMVMKYRLLALEKTWHYIYYIPAGQVSYSKRYNA